MRIALISDIHGNALALDAVLADLRGAPPDRIVCLGDAIQGGPQPAHVVERLRALVCPVVMGNADAWLLSGVETGSEPISTERRQRLNAVRAWSLAQLSPDDRAFIAAFPPTVRVSLGSGRELLAFHGSPASFDDFILPATPLVELQRMLGGHAGHILAGGHTHLPQWLRLGDSLFINPGSVGLAHAHHQPEGVFRADPWAEYALLTADGERLSVEFRRVPFDVAALVRVYRASGRPSADEAERQYGLAA